MKYSFILIAYNEENTIIACIHSILRQHNLGSSYEIIVVDDGSTDKTKQLVADLGKDNQNVRAIGDGYNHGRGFSRYTGVNDSVGEYIIMVDADIVLPTDWLDKTLPYMSDYDVAGGIAVPDGDVAYIYKRFELRPKIVMGSTTVTGNNGMYNRRIFANLNFNPTLREGEDVDFNNRATKLGIKEYCIPGLTVEHQEHKSFVRSLHWLYQSGQGATRQLMHYHTIRLPDVAFVVTFFSFGIAVVAVFLFQSFVMFSVPLLGILGASALHIHGKFYFSFKRPLQALGAYCTDCLLIACYYVGRLVGFVAFFYQAYRYSNEESSKPLL